MVIFGLTLKKGCIDMMAKNPLRYSKQSGMSDNVVSAIYHDRKGDYWFGTDVEGWTKFDGKSFMHITMKDDNQ